MKTIAFLLILIPAVANAQCGDPNQDGQVSTSDALQVLQAAVTTEGGNPETEDVNSDGEINAGDALMVLRAALGLPADLVCPVQVFFHLNAVVPYNGIDVEIFDFTINPFACRDYVSYDILRAFAVADGVFHYSAVRRDPVETDPAFSCYVDKDWASRWSDTGYGTAKLWLMDDSMTQSQVTLETEMFPSR